MELRPTTVVAGGDALARAADGRVVFVAGALPGELVTAEIVEERRDFLRARAIAVTEPSPGRIRAVDDEGCAACGWDYVDLGLQRDLKQAIVRDALVRVGKLAADDVDRLGLDTMVVGDGTGRGIRTTVRAAVDETGVACFRRPGSAELVPAAGCVVTAPPVDEVLREGRFPGADEVIVRASIASGEVALLTLPEEAADAAGGRGVVHEEVAGRRFAVSIRSFFQAGPAVADALVTAVLAGVDGIGEGGGVVDLYAGVGLFASVVGARLGVRVAAVEVDASAASDAVENLADVAADVFNTEVGRWRVPSRIRRQCEVIVADPARPGLGRPGVATVAACEPARVVLVSCDAASLGRDVKLLAEAGWRLTSCRLVDAFPHTPHVEVVSVLQSAV